MLKKILKWIGYAVLGIIVVIGGLCGWIAVTDLPHFETKALATTRYTDSAHLELGKRVVLSRCAYCHLGDDGRLSGRKFSPADSPFGEMWSRNITQSTAHGIADYSDGELAYLLRTGISRKGRFVGPYMASPTQSDEEISCIISYLRSPAEVVQPSEVPSKENHYSFILKAVMKLGMFAPIEYDGKPRPTVNTSDEKAYGKYLVQSRYECASCHSQSFETNNPYIPENSPGYLGGGNEIMDKEFHLTPSANLTPSKQHGLGSWNFEQFAATVRTGTNPSGKVLSGAMPRLVSADSAEIHAIWTYLQSVPALENAVVAHK